MDTSLELIPLSNLRAHPSNSNVMPEPLLEKLAKHVKATGQYPPLIVRPAPDELDAYQVIDGHHRWRVLEQLGHEHARCDSWQADDEQVLVLLATLNRLQGADDPLRRSQLMDELRARFGKTAAQLAKLLPESADAIDKLATLQQPRPRPAQPPKLDTLPRATHFFLLSAEQAELDQALDEIGGTREQALMQMVRRSNSHG